MGTRAIFEPQLDGCSVIIWESGQGTRIIYPTEIQAENAARWLTEKSRQFHSAKERNGVVGVEDELMLTIVAFDQPMTEFSLVRHFLERARKAGFDIQGGLMRGETEYW